VREAARMGEFLPAPASEFEASPTDIRRSRTDTAAGAAGPAGYREDLLGLQISWSTHQRLVSS